MTDKLYRVLYCSRTSLSRAPEALDDEISQILGASRRNNAAGGISGGLLFSDGCFAQVLEGPVAAVGQTFERIQCDERHREVTVLEAEMIQSRHFPAWSMGFAGTGSAHRLSAAGQGVAASIAGAMAGYGCGAQEMLDMLKAVIVREDDRLALT